MARIVGGSYFVVAQSRKSGLIDVAVACIHRTLRKPSVHSHSEVHHFNCPLFLQGNVFMTLFTFLCRYNVRHRSLLINLFLLAVGTCK